MSRDVDFILSECPTHLRNEWEKIIEEIGEDNFRINWGLYEMMEGLVRITCPFFDGFGIDDGLGDEHTLKIFHTIRNKRDEWREFLNSPEPTTFDEVMHFLCSGALIERPYRPLTLLELLKSQKLSHLTDEEVWKLIEDIWIDGEMNSSNRQLWEKIFSIRKVPSSLTKHLPNEMVVYRGGNPDGLSWTLSKEQGLWFANRFDEDLPLCSMKIKKEDVLFFTDKREEDEVIVLANDNPVEFLDKDAA
jgi:hypothetical protein